MGILSLSAVSDSAVQGVNGITPHEQYLEKVQTAEEPHTKVSQTVHGYALDLARPDIGSQLLVPQFASHQQIDVILEVWYEGVF